MKSSSFDVTLMKEYFAKKIGAFCNFFIQFLVFLTFYTRYIIFHKFPQSAKYNS